MTLEEMLECANADIRQALALLLGYSMRSRNLNIQLMEAQKKIRELEIQFGTCSVCGYVAWKERGKMEDCQYCAMKKTILAHVIHTTTEVHPTGLEGHPPMSQDIPLHGRHEMPYSPL